MNAVTQSRLRLVALAGVCVAVGGGGGYWLAAHRHPGDSPGPRETAPALPEGGRRVLYWYDPMVPQQHFARPGRSPFMDMALVPKYADDAGPAGGVRIDPAVTQNLGVRLARVERGKLAVPVLAVGTVRWNERQIAVVQTRAAGFVERVYARAPGDILASGAPLADLLVPEWAGAETEFLALRQAGDAALTQAARARLKLLGVPDAQVARVEATGRVQPVTTVRAPIAGVVQTLDVRAGMSLAAGQTLATINGLDPVWLEAAVPEALAGALAIGNPVTASLTAYPERNFTGTVVAVLPEASLDSRTLRVRVELPNPDRRLRAGLSAQLRLTPDAGRDALLVPSEAVIRTGTRALVMVALAGGRFQPTDVTLGQEAGGRVVVLAGLREGQTVVASGQFLIDSEANLKGVVTRSAAPGESPAAPAPAVATPVLHRGEGRVEVVTKTEITLSHGPIATLNWGPMTMPFELARPALAAGLKPGDRVRFSLREDHGSYIVENLDRTADGGAP